MSYLIYGLGISGISAAKSLSISNEVTVTDDNHKLLKNSKKVLNSDVSFKVFDEINFAKIDKVIFAPGIPLYYPKRHPILDKKEQYGFKLICDIEAFYQLNHNDQFIGITGTNGKSTTTALTSHIFKDLGINSDMGGNIGVPAFDLQKNLKNTTYILEFSSYQLDLVNKTKLDIACLLNITPDHIDRHGSIENYINTKSFIFNNQSSDDYALVNIDDVNTKSIFNKLTSRNKQNIIALSTSTILDNGFSYNDDKVTISTDFLSNSFSLKHHYLQGDHNKQNILSSLAITICFLHKNNIEIDLDKVIKSINSFKGLKHRQEHVKSLDNINFINDSKATNSQSTKTALSAYKNIFLILGGREKDGIDDIITDLKGVKKIYLIGESSKNFASILQKSSIDFEINKELKIAIQNAYSDALKSNNTNQVNIVLSPACSSFDQFKNFEERGDYFCKIVNELQKS